MGREPGNECHALPSGFRPVSSPPIKVAVILLQQYATKLTEADVSMFLPLGLGSVGWQVGPSDGLVSPDGHLAILTSAYKDRLPTSFRMRDLGFTP
eukprot:137345-Pyramimonas_sp.AAC.1